MIHTPSFKTSKLAYSHTQALLLANSTFVRSITLQILNTMVAGNVTVKSNFKKVVSPSDH